MCFLLIKTRFVIAIIYTEPLSWNHSYWQQDLSQVLRWTCSTLTEFLWNSLQWILPLWYLYRKRLEESNRLVGSVLLWPRPRWSHIVDSCPLTKLGGGLSRWWWCGPVAGKARKANPHENRVDLVLCDKISPCGTITGIGYCPVSVDSHLVSFNQSISNQWVFQSPK